MRDVSYIVWVDELRVYNLSKRQRDSSLLDLSFLWNFVLYDKVVNAN